MAITIHKCYWSKNNKHIGTGNSCANYFFLIPAAVVETHIFCTVVMSWLSYCCRLSWSFSHDTHVKFVQFVFTQNLLWRWLRTLKERGPRPQWSPSPPTGSGWSACPLGMSCSIFLQKKTSLFLIQLIFKAQNGYRYLLDRQTKCTFPRFKNYLVYVLLLIWLPQLFIIHIVWLFDVALCRRQAVTNSANTFYATKRLIGRRCFSVLMDLIWIFLILKFFISNIMGSEFKVTHLQLVRT